MTARYVVVRSLDGTESIIPNETLISSTVINHSFTEHRVRVALPLRDRLRQRSCSVRVRSRSAAAKAQARVLADPAPFVSITGLGDSGIDLELGVFVGDPEQGTGRSAHRALRGDCCGASRPRGSHIPYPQRDVQLRRGRPDGSPRTLKSPGLA